MALYDIISAMKTKMEGIPDIGVVHDYERWSISWAEFLAFYQYGSVIRGWTLSRRRTTESLETSASNLRHHEIICKGIMSLDDSSASEKTFQNFIESLCETFRPEDWLTTNAYIAAPPEVSVVEVRMVGNVLCHYTELIFRVDERWPR